MRSCAAIAQNDKLRGTLYVYLMYHTAVQLRPCLLCKPPYFEGELPHKALLPPLHASILLGPLKLVCDLQFMHVLCIASVLKLEIATVYGRMKLAFIKQ